MTGPDDDALVQGFATIRGTHLGRVGALPIDGASPRVVVGRDGRWGLYRRHQGTLQVFERADQSSDVLFEGANAPDFRDVVTVQLDPLRLFVLSDSHVSVRNRTGEVARFEHEAWGGHCRSDFAFDPEASRLRSAVPDSTGAADGATAIRGTMRGRAARLIIWNIDTDTVEYDEPFCSSNAGFYRFLRHPKEDAVLVVADLEFGDHRTWRFSLTPTGITSRELPWSGRPEEISANGRDVLCTAGDMRMVSLGPGSVAYTQSNVGVARWPDLEEAVELNDATLFKRSLPSYLLEGFDTPAVFLNSDTIIVKTVRGRLLLIDRSTMAVRGQLDVNNSAAGNPDAAQLRIHVLDAGTLIADDSRAHYDLWSLGETDRTG